MTQAFPEADIYTSAFNPEKTFPELASLPIKATWLSLIVRDHRLFQWSFLIATFAMQFLDLRAYDLILSSSTTVAKYVTKHKACHISYCHFPTRAIWHHGRYFGQGIKYRLFRLLLRSLERRDLKAASGVDHFIANSRVTQAAIERYYGRSSDLLHPPVETSKFKLGDSSCRGSHYLVVSRLEIWKQIDYVVETFNGLNARLRIVGAGNDRKRLERLARENIEFVGQVSDEALSAEYSSAKAVIFPTEMEFGLTPLEANAAGTPVVALGRGGVCEVMIPWTPEVGSDPTAIFYEEATCKALKEALRQFDLIEFNGERLRQHASNWDITTFQNVLRDKVLRFYSSYRESRSGACRASRQPGQSA
jgi:glycosyltransferase involved in cell wall biosynthesis